MDVSRTLSHKIAPIAQGARAEARQAPDGTIDAEWRALHSTYTYTKDEHGRGMRMRDDEPEGVNSIVCVSAWAQPVV